MIDVSIFCSGADLLAINADQNMPYDICEEDSTLQFIEQAMAKRGWCLYLVVYKSSVHALTEVFIETVNNLCRL